jgi:beta-lactamase regulating signal transducer with metallopeptidase domain
MTDVQVVVRATVILVVGLAVVGISARASASTRALWLAVTFAALLLLPLASVSLPRARIAVPLLQSGNGRLSTAPSAPARPIVSAGPLAPPTAPSAFSWSLEQWLVGLWLTGVVLTALPVALAVTAASRLRRCGRLWPRGTKAFRSLVTSPSALRPVRVIRDETVHIPCTVAFMRPAIVFPADASRWSDADVQRVLIHEYEHVRRGDWLVHIGCRLVCAVYWFHPLAWLALGRLRAETERACDDAVVQAADAPAYAEQLVNLAARVSTVRAAPLLPVVRGSELSARVSFILDPGCRRERTTAAARWVALAVGAAFSGLVAATELTSIPVHAAQQSPAGLGRILPVEAANMGADAAQGGARLSGTLYDPFGQPLEGVVLGIESLQFGDPPMPPRSTPFYRAVRTDANGRYTFDRVPPGLYGLAAPTTDFVPGERFVLRADEDATRDVHMRIDPATEAVTVCRDCQSRTNAFELPDSIRREFERDEEIALSAAVAAAEPETGVLTGEVIAPYPTSLKDRPLEGHAVVEGVIAANGTSQAMRVTSATDAALGTAAMDVLALERWKPASVRGVAVEAPFRVRVAFVLK